MSNFYLGIDPGKNGGIALVNYRGKVIHLVSMPETLGDLDEALKTCSEFAIDGHTISGALEKVGGYIGKGQPGSAMFNFGKGVGHLQALLYAHEIPYEEITPQKWQKAIGVSSKKEKETGTQWKNRLRGVAQKLFPRQKITLATADALLIAEYLRRKHEGVK
jgi:hypothetical protein